jgi:hypothetical protein
MNNHKKGKIGVEPYFSIYELCPGLVGDVLRETDFKLELIVVDSEWWLDGVTFGDHPGVIRLPQEADRSIEKLLDASRIARALTMITSYSGRDLTSLVSHDANRLKHSITMADAMLCGSDVIFERVSVALSRFVGMGSALRLALDREDRRSRLDARKVVRILKLLKEGPEKVHVLCKALFYFFDDRRWKEIDSLLSNDDFTSGLCDPGESLRTAKKKKRRSARRDDKPKAQK